MKGKKWIAGISLVIFGLSGITVYGKDSADVSEECVIREESFIVTRADEKIYSILGKIYEYSSTAYPVSYVSGVTYDLATGEELELNDVVYDPEEFKSAAISFIKEYMSARYDEYGNEITIEQIESFWDTEMEWCLDANGITVIFNEDTLGPHAMGMIEIPLALADSDKYLKEEYTGCSDVGVYRFPANLPIEIQDEEDFFYLVLNQEETEYDWAYSVSNGDIGLDLDTFGYLRNAYYLKDENGQKYLLVDVDMASEDYATYLVRVGEDEIVQTDMIFAGINAETISHNALSMESWLHLLGTYNMEKIYTIDTNGKFVSESEEYTLKGNIEEQFEIKTTVELPFFIDDKASVIPAGTGLRMLATDEESYARMLISETGQEGELPFVRGEGEDSWKIYIGDRIAEDCFEMLPYAG